MPLIFGVLSVPPASPTSMRAGHLERRHRLIAAFDHGARAAGDDLAAREQRLDRRVILELLECLEGLEARILVIQADDESDIHPIVVQVIKEAAAVGAAVERPPDRMLNEAGLHAPGRQLPQLLEAEAIGLRRLAGVELEAADQLLRGAAAAAFAEHGDLGVNFGSQREIRSRLAVLLDAHVADAHALHGAGLHRTGPRRPRIPANTSTPSFSASAPEDRHQLSQRDDEVAVIGHLRRRDGQLDSACGGS